MAASGASVVDDRAGIMFSVELYVPWDALEAVVDVSSASVVPLRSVPDVIGLVGRREGAAESCVLQGRDTHSVRVLVPDCRGLDQNFPDVTIVDMGDVPESHISLPELSTLIQQWQLAVINHMGWRQRELEEMRAVAKTRYRQSRPSCTFCGIKCDMYRHVARCHLDLAQLWRCPVLWCTVWKGTPQDCMDHIRVAQDVPGEIKSASLEKYLPPWTVTRQVWMDSLTPGTPGSLQTCCCSVTLDYRWFTTTECTSSSLMCPAGSPNAVVASPTTSRRAVRRRRPVRVMESPVQNVPVLTVQDPLAVAGAVVLDCRPPLLPVSMDIRGVDLLAIRAPAVSAGAGVLPLEREQLFGGVDLLSLICPELGVTPLVDPGTDVEDEWPTSAASPVPVVNRVAPLSAQADVDIELCQVSQDVGALPEMVTPVGDPEGGGSVVTPARYPVPPIPDSSVVMAEPLEVTSPAGPTGEGPAIPRSSTGSVVRSLVSPSSPVMSTPEGDPVVQGGCHGSISAMGCRLGGSRRIALCLRLP